jgi:hypothetical protein
MPALMTTCSISCDGMAPRRRYLMARDPTSTPRPGWRDWLRAARQYRVPGPWMLIVTTPVRYCALRTIRPGRVPPSWHGSTWRSHRLRSGRERQRRGTRNRRTDWSHVSRSDVLHRSLSEKVVPWASGLSHRTVCRTRVRDSRRREEPEVMRPPRGIRGSSSFPVIRRSPAPQSRSPQSGSNESVTSPCSSA